MIGKLYVGPHERLRAATDPAKLTPARLSEIDYAHPRDIPAIIAAMPSTAERWTNHPRAVDAVPAGQVIVLRAGGKCCTLADLCGDWTRE